MSSTIMWFCFIDTVYTFILIYVIEMLNVTTCPIGGVHLNPACVFCLLAKH